MPLEFYKPKRIQGTKTFTQSVWDPENEKGYIVTMSLEQVIEQRQSGLLYAEEIQKYDHNSTFVEGITCKKCKKELPRMTMKQHLDGDFDQNCPHDKTKNYDTPSLYPTAMAK